MEFKEITPVRLYESAIEQIMDLVKRSELKPGDKLPPERELAERLSISRGSLREAFRVLESRGIIKSKPGGGRYIREIRKNGYSNTENIILSLEKSSILELLEAREIFEVKIAKIAAQRATVEDIKSIEEALNKMISWDESSCVIFANSVLGTRTNRTTIGVNIASSIVGRVPEYGLLLDRNRKGNILIKLNFESKSLFEYGTLGYIIGKLCGGKIPVIENLPESTNVNHLKVLGASMATKGGISIFHAVGITP